MPFAFRVPFRLSRHAFAKSSSKARPLSVSALKKAQRLWNGEGEVWWNTRQLTTRTSSAIRRKVGGSVMARKRYRHGTVCVQERGARCAVEARGGACNWRQYVGAHADATCDERCPVRHARSPRPSRHVVVVSPPARRMRRASAMMVPPAAIALVHAIFLPAKRFVMPTGMIEGSANMVQRREDAAQR